MRAPIVSGFMIRMAVSLLAVGCLLCGSVEAGQRKGVELILEKHRISSSDAREITRNYRAVVAVGAAPARVEALVDGALAAGFKPDDLVRCLDIVAAAGLNGLPHDSLLAKVAEGVAKKVDADDVIDAVEHRALSLKRARQILSSVIYDVEGKDDIGLLIQAVGSAVERGIGERDILELLKDGGADAKKVLYQLDKMR